MAPKKAKFYSTNVTGRNLVIKAFSMKQIASYFGEPLREIQLYTSICGPAVKKEADIDLTENEAVRNSTRLCSEGGDEL